MSLEELYETDESAEREGAWFPYGGGMEMRLAFAGPGHTAFSAAKSKAERELSRRYGTAAEIPDLEWRKALAPAYADHIVLDWKGVRRKKGEPELPCTRENVIEVLANPRYPKLFPKVVRDCANDEAYRALERESGN